MPQTESPGQGSRRGAAVAFFAKAPRKGIVKTRLCPPLRPEEAAALYGTWVTASVVALPQVRTLVYGWPEDGIEEISGLIPSGIEVRRQVGEDLFTRMAACFAELFAEGHSPVVIRGTDSPDVPPRRIEEAIARAAPGRVVIGPDHGGGYYLIALSEPRPELRLDEPAAHARELGLRIEMLVAERDVDEFADLLALWQGRLLA
jgi:glycosyltransferase A (GT-A) superfamily protein (DUF2064 family)